MNSRRKGAVGEREFAEYLRAEGFEARRGQQFSGSPDSPDVVTSIVGAHFEVKRCEKLNVHDAMVQAETDAAQDETPIVAHRRNRTPWLVTMRACDFLRMVKRLSGVVPTERGT